MSVGNQLTAAGVSNSISGLAQQLRNLCWSIQNLSKNVNGQGNGLVVLEAAGFTAADASTAQAAISYLNTVASIYYGTATQATTFDFDNELSQYRGGS